MMKSERMFGRWIVVGTAAAMAVMASGCASMSDSQRTTAQGAGMGAALGAALGGVIGHQSGSGMEGAVIGGLLGAAGGAAYGNHVASKKEQYASDEAYIDAVLEQARQVRDDTEQRNIGLQTEIAQLDVQVTEMVAALADGTAARTEAVALQKQLELKLADARTGLKTVSDEILIQREVVSSEEDTAERDQLRALEATIAELEEQKDELTLQTERLADLSSRMSV